MQDKKQNTILLYIKKFFDFYGNPKEFGTDNGREFINPAVNTYLLKNNIKMINSLPYNPHAQGSVERLHFTIRNMLLSEYIENYSNFNIEYSLDNVMNIYNQLVNRTTKYSPNEIFYNTNPEFHKVVYKNILEYYNKNTKNFPIFNIGEKCLMINTIIKSKHKTKDGIICLLKNKVKKNKNFIKICVNIVKSINGGNYIIKINGNYEQFKIKDNEMYCVSNNLLIKCEENIWNDYYKYIASNLQSKNIEEDSENNCSVNSNNNEELSISLYK